MLRSVVCSDMLRYDPGKAAAYPNGRALTDHVVAARLALISNNRIPSDGLRTSTICSRFRHLGIARILRHHRCHRS